MEVPAAINTDMMTDDQIHEVLIAGINEADRAVDAGSAFAEFTESHR